MNKEWWSLSNHFFFHIFSIFCCCVPRQYILLLYSRTRKDNISFSSSGDSGKNNNTIEPNSEAIISPEFLNFSWIQCSTKFRWWTLVLSEMTKVSGYLVTGKLILYISNAPLRLNTLYQEIPSPKQKLLESLPGWGSWVSYKYPLLSGDSLASHVWYGRDTGCSDPESLSHLLGPNLCYSSPTLLHYIIEIIGCICYCSLVNPTTSKYSLTTLTKHSPLISVTNSYKIYHSIDLAINRVDY